ncbi:MAG: hypothetical protein OXG35_12775, partial [Acidobacteria bacterium]|nr:hypothetical protein [Acidobacteriota bacterium]
ASAASQPKGRVCGAGKSLTMRSLGQARTRRLWRDGPLGVPTWRVQGGEEAKSDVYGFLPDPQRMRPLEERLPVVRATFRTQVRGFLNCVAGDPPDG